MRDANLLLLRGARMLGAGKAAILRKVVFPSALPSIFTGLRLDAGVAWTAVIVTEMVAVKSGLNRRGFVCRAISMLVAAPLAAEALQAERVHRVALVFTTAPEAEMLGLEPAHPMPRAFLRALRTLGYVEGRNLAYMPRSAEGTLERLGEILADLARRRVDVIVAPGDEIPRRAREVTPTVPFVMMSFTDPVDLGLVASLAHPRGNFTGLTRTTSPDIEGKRLELLKEGLPQVARVSYLGMKANWDGPVGQSARNAACCRDVHGCPGAASSPRR